MVAEIRDPTGDTGKGVGETVPETWRDRTTGMAQDLVLEKVVTLVGEMKITEEAEVREVEMVTVPTPRRKMDIECWAAFRTVIKELGCSK